MTVVIWDRDSAVLDTSPVCGSSIGQGVFYLDFIISRIYNVSGLIIIVKSGVWVCVWVCVLV